MLTNGRGGLLQKHGSTGQTKNPLARSTAFSGGDRPYLVCLTCNCLSLRVDGSHSCEDVLSTATGSHPGQKTSCHDSGGKEDAYRLKWSPFNRVFRLIKDVFGSMRPFLMALMADLTPSSTASVTMDLILETSRRSPFDCCWLI